MTVLLQFYDNATNRDASLQIYENKTDYPALLYFPIKKSAGY